MENEVIDINKLYQLASEQTLETFPQFLNDLLRLPEDYNIEIYLRSISMYGLMKAINKSTRGSISGEQAHAIAWEMIGVLMGIRGSAWILQLDEMLYPGNYHKFTSINVEQLKYLQDLARRKLLENNSNAVDTKHFQMILSGGIPFNYHLHNE